MKKYQELEATSAEKLAQAQERLHVLNAIELFLDNRQEVFEIICNSSANYIVSRKLQEHFGIDESQCNVILNLRLSNATTLYIERIKEEISEIKNIITQLDTIK